MNTKPHVQFKADRSLKINIAVAIVLVILCPLALWQFYFRYDHIGDQNQSSPKELVMNYCREYNKPVFHSAAVLAPHVDVFFGQENVTPVDIDHAVAIERQTIMYPRLTLLADSMTTTNGPDESQVVEAWIDKVVYHKGIMQYGQRQEKLSFTFNKEGKITSLELLSAGKESLSRNMPDQSR